MVIGSVLDGLVRNVAFLPPTPPTYSVEIEPTHAVRLVLEPWAADMMYAYDLRRELVECQVVSSSEGLRRNSLREGGHQALSFARPFVVPGKQGDLIAAWIPYQDPEARDKAGFARRHVGSAPKAKAAPAAAPAAPPQAAPATLPQAAPPLASARGGPASTSSAAVDAPKSQAKPAAARSPGILAAAEAARAGARAEANGAGRAGGGGRTAAAGGGGGGAGASGGGARAASSRSSPPPPPSDWVGTFQAAADAATRSSPSPAASAAAAGAPRASASSPALPASAGAPHASASTPAGDWMESWRAPSAPQLRRPQTVPRCPASGAALKEVLAGGAPGASPAAPNGGAARVAKSPSETWGAAVSRSAYGSGSAPPAAAATRAPAGSPGPVLRAPSTAAASEAPAGAKPVSRTPSGSKPVSRAPSGSKPVSCAPSGSNPAPRTPSSSAPALRAPTTPATKPAAARTASAPAPQASAVPVARSASTPSAAASAPPASLVARHPSLSATLRAPAWRRWSLPPPSSWPPRVVFYSHGNAIDLGMAVVHARGLAQALRCDVVCWDYAGYGASQGRPSASGLAGDATRVLAFLVDELRIPSDRIIVYGQSIGSAAACGSAAAWAARGGGGGGLGWGGVGQDLARASLSPTSKGTGALGGLSQSIAHVLARHSVAATDADGERSRHRGHHHGHGHGHGHDRHASGGAPSPPPAAGTSCSLAGVILHSPLASGMRVLSPGVAWWPGSLDVLTNDDRVKRIRAPLLVVHGLADRVVDVSNGMRLHKLARSAVAPLFLDGRGHDDLENDPRFWKRIVGFVNERLG